MNPAKQRSDCRFLHDDDEPIADLARARGRDDCLHGTVQQTIGNHHLKLHLGQKIHHVFGAAIQLGMAFLTAKAFDFGDGQACDANVRKRIAHFIEFERFDDGFYFFQGNSPSGRYLEVIG